MDLAKVSAVLFQELLDHVWKVQGASRAPVLQLYPEGCLITYASLCTKAQMRELTHEIGQPLHAIAAFCKARGWPPLTALVVHHETRYPGSDYFGAPGCATNLEGWEKDVAKVLQFEEYPRIAPPLGAYSSAQESST